MTVRLEHWHRRARPVDDWDALLAAIGDARYVLLGEASHGTSEYYRLRAEITMRLVVEKGFGFVAVEGDWPDCYRINRYVKDMPEAGASAYNVLHGFDRWPTWMWANREVEGLVEQLRDYNAARPGRAVGFYGLDVYSLHESLEAVLRYLDRIDPGAAVNARRAAACFEPYAADLEEYARASQLAPVTCEHEVIRLLAMLRAGAARYREDGRDAYFNAEQNALVARNAERYYRAMLGWGPASWNVRDRHMVETLERLMAFHGDRAKCVVWAHNTHVGDARATDMAAGGMVNLGQLVREAHAREDVFVVGFGSHRGSVIAAEAWGAPMERMRVPPAPGWSLEGMLHEVEAVDRYAVLRDEALPRELTQPLGHRAIGVVYHPHREPRGNYVPTVLGSRYDAFVYLERSHALRALHGEAHLGFDVPETYPTGE